MKIVEFYHQKTYSVRSSTAYTWTASEEDPKTTWKQTIWTRTLPLRKVVLRSYRATLPILVVLEQASGWIPRFRRLRRSGMVLVNGLMKAWGDDG